MSDIAAAETNYPPESGDVDDLKPERTERSQKLYNDLRDAEMNQQFAAQLRLRQRPRDKRRSRRPRRDSMNYCAPQWSHVTTSTYANIPAPTAAKSSGRNGPLNDLIRAKAAFTRSIGACDHCRIKKTGCKHWVLDDFEQVYQELRRNDPLPPNVEQSRASDAELPVNPRSDQTDLLGLEQTASTDVAELRTGAGTGSDTSDLLQSPAERDNWQRNKELPVLLPRVGTGSAHTCAGDSTQRRAEEDGNLVAIGQQLTTNGGIEWACRYFDEGINDVPASPRAYCGARFATTNELQKHFSAAHYTVGTYDQVVWFQCRLCALLSDEDWYCVRCGLADGIFVEQERWMYGYASTHIPPAAWDSYIEMLLAMSSDDAGNNAEWLGYTPGGWEEVCRRNFMMQDNDLASQDWMMDIDGGGGGETSDVVSFLWPSAE